MYHASVSVIPNKFLLALTNTLAFYVMELITAVKSFVILTPDVKTSAQSSHKEILRWHVCSVIVFYCLLFLLQSSAL